MTRIAGQAKRSRLLPGSIVGALSVALFLGILQIGAETGLIRGYLVPSPLAVLKSFPMLIEDEGLASRCVSTLTETVLSATAATVVGIAVGWAMVRYPLLKQAYHPWVVVIAAAPIVLLYPIFLVFLGRGIASIVVMSFLSALTPVTLSACDGLASVRRVLLDVGKGLRLTTGQLFWKIELPAAVPALFRGIRLGLIYAFLTVVGFEYLTTSGGVGELLADLADRYETPGVYGTIATIMVLSGSCLWIVNQIERSLRPVPWSG